MKSFLFLVLFCVSIFGFPFAVQAKDTPELIVRVVNVQKVMGNSTAVKGLRKQLNAYREKYDAEFVKKEKALQDEDRELVKQKTLLTPEAYRNKVKEFRLKFAKFQKELKLRQQQLDAAYSFAIGKVSKQIKQIWLDVAKKERASLVLRSVDVLMFSQKYDVTDEVVSRLNKALPSVAFPDPEKFGTSQKHK